MKNRYAVRFRLTASPEFAPASDQPDADEEDVTERDPDLTRLRGFAVFRGVRSLFINELDEKVVRGAKVWAWPAIRRAGIVL
jgi:hypothetical protein